MNDRSESVQAFVTQLLTEHARLRQCVKALQQRWEKASSSELSPNETQALVIGLGGLRAELAHHFAQEESGGCLEEAVTTQPSLCKQAAQQEHEHAELLSILDGIIERTDSSLTEKSRLESLKDEFGCFATRLNEHEQAERKILQDSFGVDLDS